VGLHMTRQARRLARRLASLGDARLPALSPWRFWAGRRACLTGLASGSVTARRRASRGKRLRVAAAGRHSSLRIQVCLENTPQMSKDGNVVVEVRYVVNMRSYHEVVMLNVAMRGRP
jgi:hypothetical protein